MPSIVPIVIKQLASGKNVFKRGNRRVSASAYRSQQWRLGGGKAGTARKRAIQKSIEAEMRVDWGAPQAGWTWVKLANKYPERFEGYMGEYEERFV